MSLLRAYVDTNNQIYNVGELLNTWSLISPSRARAFPAYVPAVVIADYQEACQVLPVSPKASATLARRCLQGMIRDFWKITKGRLLDEIAALEDKVDPDTWSAIDAVRKIGNIGAHMEKDVNLIIDVDQDEAEQLIWLIEHLVNDWYITRNVRQLRLAELKQIAEEKEAARKAPQKDDQATA